MKAMIIRWVLPMVIDTLMDFLVDVLKNKAKDTKSQVDDRIVEILDKEKISIKVNVLDQVKKRV